MCKYDNVISLGFKCETAFVIEAVFGKVESNLFNWVSQNDNIDSLIKVLQNPDLLMSEGLEFEEYNAFMYKDKALGFRYHSKMETDILNSLQGQEREDYISKMGEEVTSRMNYLKNKFFSKVKSNDKNLFIMCFNSGIPKDRVFEILEKLSNVIYEISCNKESKLMVVFEKNFINKINITNFINNIYKQHNNILVETVSSFSSDYTQDFKYNDWLKIYKKLQIFVDNNPDYKNNYKKYSKKYRLNYYRRKAFRRFLFSQRKIYKYVNDKPVLYREYTILGKVFEFKIK